MRIEISVWFSFHYCEKFAFHDVYCLLKNDEEQTEEHQDIFYIFTFEEEDFKDLKINNVKRKGNFGFRIFPYRSTILEFLIFYIKNWSMTVWENYYCYLRMSPEQLSHLLSLVYERISKKHSLDFERVFLLKKV